jgi:hypothetical protein
MLAAVLAAGLVTSANAQGQRRGGGFGGGFGGRGGGGINMLRSADVQKELKMTQPQIEKVDAKGQEVMQAIRDAFQGGGNPQDQSPEQRQAIMKKVQDLQAKAVSDILDTTQQKRFKQLELQQQGGNALINNKEVAEALKITDEQKTKLQEIQQAGFQEIQNLPGRPDFQSGQQPDPAEMQKWMTKMAEARAGINAKMIATLTPAQQAKWKELTGEPFKGQFNAPFRRPGA